MRGTTQPLFFRFLEEPFRPDLGNSPHAPHRQHVRVLAEFAPSPYAGTPARRDAGSLESKSSPIRLYAGSPFRQPHFRMGSLRGMVRTHV